jgi:hypothetical protein
VRGSKGTRAARLVGARMRKLRFRAMRRDERFTVTVRALATDLRAGPVRKARERR